MNDTWTITIPNWKPASTNALLSAHWSKRGKLKREAADFVAVYGSHVPKATVKRRVTIRVTEPHRAHGGGRGMDADNLLKALLDALTTARMIVDDSQAWVECSMPVMERGPLETVITLEDVT